MAIVAGFDVHRNQITFDALETETGELARGRIDSTPDAVRAWVRRFPGRRVEVAGEACTGRLFVFEALTEAGGGPHLGETAQTSAPPRQKRPGQTRPSVPPPPPRLPCDGRFP